MGDSIIDDGRLVCIGCGDTSLHHYEVDVFECSEDDYNPLHINIAQPKKITTTVDHVGNPSKRRNGLTVKFYCECCDAITELTIAQHKGNTLIDTNLWGMQALHMNGQRINGWGEDGLGKNNE